MRNSHVLQAEQTVCGKQSKLVVVRRARARAQPSRRQNIFQAPKRSR